MFGGVTGQAQEHYEMKAVYAMPRGGFVFWSGDPGKDFSDQAYLDSDDGLRCPYGQPGDRLWVRETWRAEELASGLDGVRYAADNHFRSIENTRDASDAWGEAAFDKHGQRYNPLAWRPAIFAPRWASRITLEVIGVRVERVQDITYADVLAEGINMHSPVRKKDQLPTPRSAFAELWDSINAKRGFGWDVNPWVWVLTFKRESDGKK